MAQFRAFSNLGTHTERVGHPLSSRSLWMIVALCTMLTLPWLGQRPFHSRGEPREAITAQAMLASGNWILPERYGDDEATKPPLTHWMISLFSLPGGEVTEATSRLPSALSYIVLCSIWFVFLSGRAGRHLAWLSAIVLATCFLFFRGSTAARVDMLLTVLMVAGMLALFRWKEKGLKGIPWGAALLLGLSTLTKGPVGIVLPCFVFTIYMLLLKDSLWCITGAMFRLVPVAAVLPALWYVAAYLQGGERFLAVVIDENLARFTGKMTIGGTHEHSVFYMLASLCWGFLPWTLLPLLRLPWLKLGNKPTSGRSPKGILPSIRNKYLPLLRSWLDAQPRHRQFSLIAVLCILFFYAIPASKRDVYLMPAYPFLSLFVAEIAAYLAEQRPRLIRICARVLGILGLFVLISLLVLNIIRWPSLPGMVPGSAPAFYLHIFSHLYQTEFWMGLWATIAGWGACLWLLFGLCRQAPSIESTPATHSEGLAASHPSVASARSLPASDLMIRCGICLAGLYVVLNGLLMPGIARATSSRTFAREIHAHNILPRDVYFFRTGFYGLSFYLNNRFENIENQLPEHGFVLVGSKEMSSFSSWAENRYSYSKADSTSDAFNDMRQNIYLMQFQRLSQPGSL